MKLVASEPSRWGWPEGLGAKIQAHLQTLLTAFCGGLLLLSLLPGAVPLSYGAILAGSFFALTSAAEAIRERRIDVNILMVLAAIGAVVVGHPQDAAGLLFLFSLSSALEASAMAKTKAAIQKLIQLRPSTAIRVSAAGDATVRVEELLEGDVIRVVPFDKVPTDCTILTGATSADESALTGEFVPVLKEVGATLIAGTQNLDGAVTAQVTRCVGDSTLDRIIALVDEAQNNKASGEKISDWFGEKYTVFVITAFTLSWIGRSLMGQGIQDSFYSALTLLVGLSPCALVISIPASTLSAIAKAARRGILIRGGEFIERAAEVRIVAMDKTGTLTQGKLALRSIAVQDRVTGHCRELDRADLNESAWPLLIGVASVEQHSTHPIGSSLVRAVVDAGKSLAASENTRVLPGRGIEGCVSGVSWVIGNEKLIESERGVSLKAMSPFVERWQSEGETTVFAVSDRYVLALGFGDTVRPDAAEIIRSMRSAGVQKVVMLTGDRAEAAAAVAHATTVDEVHASLMPADKTSLVKELGKEGPVMMVGDGVNDAPSLALASVGVAMGHLGSDVALEAADIVLMQDDLRRLPELLALGRKTRAIIRTNLVFASAMIVVLAVASFVTKLPLPLAVLGHEGSTVLVILNGLRLLR